MVSQIDCFPAADSNGCGTNSECTVAMVLQLNYWSHSKIYDIIMISNFFSSGKGRASVWHFLSSFEGTNRLSNGTSKQLSYTDKNLERENISKSINFLGKNYSANIINTDLKNYLPPNPLKACPSELMFLPYWWWHINNDKILLTGDRWVFEPGCGPVALPPVWGPQQTNQHVHQ